MVKFKDIWYGHPINQSVTTPCIAQSQFKNLEGRTIQPGFPVYANQCAIRMAIALRRAGVTANQLSGVAACGHHPRDEMHFINSTQLANAIARANLPGVGRTEKYKGDEAEEYYPKLFGRTGIIHIRDYWTRSTDRSGYPTGDHIDVWNGYRSSAKWLMEWFSWLGYYSNYAEGSQIWFWEVK